MSSRLFIKGLPPSISLDEFRNHFGQKFVVTDAKLIPQRRIGYIGYKNHEDAAKAVKYYNKSFIRMSKIGVEYARPISDPVLPPSRKVLRELEWQDTKSQKPSQISTTTVSSDLGTKRKRSDVDETDPKLKEFLELMQPPSKLKISDSNAIRDPQQLHPLKAEEPATVEIGKIPITSQTSPLSTSSVAQVNTPPPILSESETKVEPSTQAITSDEDWLRSRKSRLLDLVDPEEAALSVAQSQCDRIEDKKELDASHDDRAKEIDKPMSNEGENLVAESNTASLIESIKSTGRLFVRNLPYTASEDDLRQIFTPYGLVEEVHLPIDTEGGSKGFALVQYSDSTAAARAFHHLDGESFQGRLLHILPGSAKRENKFDEFAISKLPLAKQRKIKMKSCAASMSFNWNSLYMDQNAVISAVASRLGVSKSDVLDPTSAESGWKQAVAETSIIQETKSYFVSHGVDLESFKKRERGDTAILVKNLPYGMSVEELRKMFEEYGQVLRVLMPPAATIAIVEFSQPVHARAAFASLAYRRVKDSVLFLEKAPKDLFASVGLKTIVAPEIKTGDVSEQKISVSELLEPSPSSDLSQFSTLFVRNLNFCTTTERLVETFKPLAGFMSARVNTKTDPKKPGQVLSMGFGFLEFKSESQAQSALKAMDGFELDGHKLVIRASHRGNDAAEKRRREDINKKMSGKRTKIIIKNLPFEASKKDVRNLFGAYGKLRSVRVPKKFDHTTRGFGFADFITAREAENALEALKDTHLLGRRLVLEFATGEPLDAEEEIDKMQKKVTSQINKVAVQELTGRNRKKFIVGSNEDEE
ncbi:Multiple RNA-binding domain-containing protein 1 [Podosphaera aphanis]|nr:Multiple RNA-binding domain-containing protein 1 [Podosphaera aphanis]